MYFDSGKNMDMKERMSNNMIEWLCIERPLIAEETKTKYKKTSPSIHFMKGSEPLIVIDIKPLMSNTYNMQWR